MGVPAISSSPASWIPDDGHDNWPPAATTPAAMSDQLSVLASQAQYWHRTLLRTSTEILALTDASGEAAYAAAVGTDAVRAQLGGLLDGARRTTWLRADTVVPALAGRDADPVADLLLRRGSGVRVLLGGQLAWYLAGAWHDSTAEVRLTGEGPPGAACAADLIITDEQLAMTVWRSDAGELKADIVVEPSVVGILRTVWETLWACSLPLESAVRLDSLVHDEAQAAIVELLETGAKDAAIARTLGVSLRTCRRRIAELLVATGAVSRFQAGSKLARADVLGAQLTYVRRRGTPDRRVLTRPRPAGRLLAVHAAHLAVAGSQSHHDQDVMP